MPHRISDFEITVDLPIGETGAEEALDVVREEREYG